MKVIILLYAIFIFACSSRNQGVEKNEINPNIYDSRGEYVGFKSEFVKVKKGDYMMGSTFIASFQDEKPQHLVNIDRAFEVMRSELTQKMWVDLMGSNPSATVGKEYCKDSRKLKNVEVCPSHPVEMISREDVNLLVKTLNSKSKNYRYDIPTEEQWEYFARAGTQTNYFWGIYPDQSSQYATLPNDPKHSSSVMTHKANRFGLFDTAGNVWEWTKTHYVKHYYDYMEKNGRLGTQLESKLNVIRGGGWNSRIDHFRSSYRGSTSEKSKSSDLGLRLIRYRK